MAVYNGEKYLREQIDSILIQLKKSDELIISDDGSTDSTLKIINSYVDPRIKIYHNRGNHGFVSNFENALLNASGDFLFLADQDDVWFPDKISIMSRFIKLNQLDVVMNNCIVTDVNLRPKDTRNLFNNNKNPLSYGTIGNLISNQWLGCCMCLKRSVLYKCLPFPKNIIAHDFWIGLLANTTMKIGYNDIPLQYYRRHDLTASSAGGRSTIPILKRIKYRLEMVKCLLKVILSKRLG